MAFTNFSYHALKRLRQRSSLTFEHLGRLLDRGAFVNLGTKPGIRREHLLFYCAMDDECFVAIRDEATGTVVTVLPLDYHANLAWAVPSQHCDTARRLWTEVESSLDEPDPVRPSTFRVSVLFLDADGRQKAKTANTYDASRYDWNTDRLIASRGFIDDVLDAAQDKGVKRKAVFALTVRLGKKGNPVPVSLDPREISL